MKIFKPKKYDYYKEQTEKIKYMEIGRPLEI